MRTALLIWLLGAAPYDAREARARYELKCLYCHSGKVIEERRRPAQEWRKVFQRMHRRAPLLISDSDLRILFRYVTVDLALATRPPRRAVSKPPTEVEVAAIPPPLVEPEFVSEEWQPPPLAEATPAESPAEVPPHDLEAEALGPPLLEEKCSKCHPLQRVFTKLDSVEKGLSTIERMRRKTGSGISREDADLLERFVRSQF